MDRPNERTLPETIEFNTVAAAAAGDRSAFRSIYEVTSDRVFRLMVRMVGQQDTDDLTQQTFVQAFAKIGQFGGEAKQSPARLRPLSGRIWGKRPSLLVRWIAGMAWRAVRAVCRWPVALCTTRQAILSPVGLAEADSMAIHPAMCSGTSSPPG